METIYLRISSAGGLSPSSQLQPKDRLHIEIAKCPADLSAAKICQKMQSLWWEEGGRYCVFNFADVEAARPGQRLRPCQQQKNALIAAPRDQGLAVEEPIR